MDSTSLLAISDLISGSGDILTWGIVWLMWKLNKLSAEFDAFRVSVEKRLTVVETVQQAPCLN